MDGDAVLLTCEVRNQDLALVRIRKEPSNRAAVERLRRTLNVLNVLSAAARVRVKPLD